MLLRAGLTCCSLAHLHHPAQGLGMENVCGMDAEDWEQVGGWTAVRFVSSLPSAMLLGTMKGVSGGQGCRSGV